MKIQITPSLLQFWIDPGHLRSFKVIGGHFLADPDIVSKHFFLENRIISTFVKLERNFMTLAISCWVG